MTSIDKITPEVIKKLKSFDWDFIIDFGFNKVNHIKGNQYNFWRGTLMEQVIATQDKQIMFVGGDEHHKDFNWERFGITLELKSLLNKQMYSRSGKLKSTLKLNLTNLRSQRNLTKSEICDIVLVITSDGSFAIPKEIAFQNQIQKGNKIDIEVSSKYIIEISGRKTFSPVNQKIDINDMIKDFSKHTIELAKQDFNSRKRKPKKD
jgi:hypothetical protein